MSQIDLTKLSFDFISLTEGYRKGIYKPEDVIREVYRRIEAAGDNPIWIEQFPMEAAIRQAASLKNCNVHLPLYGFPCAIKDNINVAGLPTTAACPGYKYHPQQDSFVVKRLMEAGAIVVGKTNLDQFATGLTGARSPFGVCRNAINPDFISGGSSSGSAVAVALGQVSFALGTDTAGSGRVPAALNNIVGLKPSRGLVSGSGVVPASASLDCVSVFSLSVEDAQTVLNVIDCTDVDDIYVRRDRAQIAKRTVGIKVGVPRLDQVANLSESGFDTLFVHAQARMQAMGHELVDVDISPLLECGALLYNGPILAERYQALSAILQIKPDAVLPIIRKVVEPGEKFSGAEVYAAQQYVQKLGHAAEKIWSLVDVLMLPTVEAAFTIEQVLAEPIKLNARLGRYTNFVNLLDMSALALPAGFSKQGLPFGVTLLAPALHDHWLGQIGARFQQLLGISLGATPHVLSGSGASISVAVVGAHLSGQPLNYQLLERGAKLLKSCRTASCYRLYALPNTTPPKPGLVKLSASEGKGIAVEVWNMPVSQFGSFVAMIPAPLGIGTLELEDGEQVKGFMCEPYGLEGARDISEFGGWVAYLESLRE